ncbi:MAG: Ig-like domain-containing protein [Patescibacteria group bacterium]|nr:Ig-like domain-containing protein [Patescibacteria group bacterium]
MIFKLRNISLLKKAVALGVLLQLTFLFIPTISHAQIVEHPIGYIPDFGLGTDTDIEHLVTNIIQIFLGFLGFIALVIIIYGGFMWMMSGGNQEKTTKAKGILKSAIVGLIIILLSYIIVSFVMNLVYNSTHGSGGGFNNDVNNYSDEGDRSFGDGALGGGFIENHFPERDAINVPRNTMIMVTFKVPVSTSTVISETLTEGFCANYSTNGNVCGYFNKEKIQIKDGIDMLDGDEDVIAVLKSDGKSILLKPVTLLGSASSNININVHLSGIKGLNGNYILPSDGYSWNFTVSTFSDTTPPVVKSVKPANGSIYDRNAIIQINFSEPINFFSINGNIIVSSSTNPLPGELKISNKYKTVEFLSSSSCDGVTKNSCGELVYCLPASSLIDGFVRGGENGISDSALNFLTNNYVWSFNTTDTINLEVPKILSLNPKNATERIVINPDIYATFNKDISPSSVTTDNFYIYKFEESSCPNVDKKENILNTTCFPNYSVYLEEDGKSPNINTHLDKNFIYRPRLTDKIKDIYGNCFNPSLDVQGNSKQR